MEKTEIEKFLKPLSKNDLREVIALAEKQLNSSLGIGDSVMLVINYMIGDADGDTEEEYGLYIETQDDLDALNIITYILDNHTEPNKGHWGFGLEESEFSKKPRDVYNILYKQEEAPEVFNGINITPNILETIENIVDGCFRGDTEYSFLVYRGYILEQ
jgi:hypothetical protein